MYQLTFSDQSMQTLNQLPFEEQLRLVDSISAITQQELDKPSSSYGRFHRDGKTFHRIRAGDYRVYFEIRGDVLFSHYILSKKSLMDFIYRNKLPIKEEHMAEQHQSFWKYLEGLKK